MQNKKISFLSVVMATTLLTGVNAFAQKVPDLDNLDLVMAAEEDSQEADLGKSAGVVDLSQADVNNKKAVDFPARSSMDSIEMAPLPGVFETPITGPQPMAESVSVNDMPSEQLMGRLNPEVFQEMAELERDNAFLKLQIQKEEMKNNLENLRSNYRQARLDEIAKREEVIRSRIQWWQEQEKLRQEMEKERAEAEEIKNKKAEAEALAARREEVVEGEDIQDDELLAPLPVVRSNYILLDVKGMRGNLIARVRNADTQEISVVRLGDSLDGDQVKSITSETVSLDRDGEDYVIKFPVEAYKEKTIVAPEEEDAE